jgi:uncharacterized protein
MFLAAAISLGFLGSFHCVGMCGPIALVIPVKRTSALSVFAGGLVYNSGRLVTYSLMGLLFGLAGQEIVLAGWQNALSVGLGILIFLLLLLPQAYRFKIPGGIFIRSLEKVKSSIRTLFGIHTYRSLFLIGLLNGLLPCGLVYLGIVGAVATGNTLNGSLFMFGFGLGTVPAMLAVTLIKDYISIRFRERIRKTVPVFVGTMALLLILRGLNLGIPYLSPSVETSGGSCHHQCCHK